MTYCAYCGNSIWQQQALKPFNSPYTYLSVQCGRCNKSIGVIDPSDLNVENLDARLRLIEEGLSAVQNALAQLSSRLR
jgi:hypothetical protein